MPTRILRPQAAVVTGRRALLVASPGGHLAELVELAARMPGLENPIWLTPDTPQSQDLLPRARRLDVPDVRPRDVRALRHATSVALRVLREEEVDLVLSTGAGLALAALPAAALRSIETHYVESAARVTSISLTGRLLSLVPGVRLWTQYPSNAHGRWSYLGSVFDQFEVVSRPVAVARPVRVVVTLGTMHAFSFERLLRRLSEILPSDAEIIWQTGSSDAKALGIENARSWIPPGELEVLMARADVVVAHAGVGSAIAAMRTGAFPILIPRRAKYGEHVDDHQLQVGSHLAALGLAYSSEVEDLTEPLVGAARRLRLRRRDQPMPLLGLNRPVAA